MSAYELFSPHGISYKHLFYVFSIFQKNGQITKTNANNFNDNNVIIIDDEIEPKSSSKDSNKYENDNSLPVKMNSSTEDDDCFIVKYA